MEDAVEGSWEVGTKEVCQPNTPVMVKVGGIHQKMKEEQEEGERNLKQRKKVRPIGKEQLNQPTLDSFLSIRSGLVGSGGERGYNQQTSHIHNQAIIGEGLVPGPMEGSLQIFRE